MARSVILSFDDGPAAPGEELASDGLPALKSILETLKLHKITAEFYVIGVEVKRFPQGARMITEAGHKIQNHTWSHPELNKASLDVVKKELTDTQRIIQEATGATATKIRPPFGAGGWPGRLDPEIDAVAKSLKLEVHNWDVDTEDWKRPRGLASKLDGIKKQLDGKASLPRPADVLMHVQKETAADLPAFVAALKGWGLSFAVP